MLRVRMNCQFCCITFLLLVLTTSCFSYIYWDPTLGGQILRCFDFIFIYIFFQNKKKIFMQILRGRLIGYLNWLFYL